MANSVGGVVREPFANHLHVSINVQVHTDRSGEETTSSVTCESLNEADLPVAWAARAQPAAIQWARDIFAP